MRAEATAFLQKPFDSDVLLATIEAARLRLIVSSGGWQPWQRWSVVEWRGL